jgi:hypothetical protein
MRVKALLRRLRGTSMSDEDFDPEQRMTLLIEVARRTGKSLDDLYDRSLSMAASDFTRFCGNELSTPRYIQSSVTW